MKRAYSSISDKVLASTALFIVTVVAVAIGVDMIKDRANKILGRPPYGPRAKSK